MKTHLISFTLLSSLIFIAGCTTVPQQGGGEVNPNERLMLMTNELGRLDSTLKQTAAELEAERQKSADLEAQLQQAQQPTYMSMTPQGPVPALSTLASNMYKTPSGFEVPAKDIQLALKNAGYYGGEIDGEIGPDSRSCVEKFQAANGLPVDGVIGPKTWQKLKAYL